MFRVRGSQVEISGINELPAQLVADLRLHRNDLYEHLAKYEVDVASKETSSLLSWGNQLCESGLVSKEPITYVESRQRDITTDQVSSVAGIYMKIVAFSRLSQSRGHIGPWTAERWREQEIRALEALRSLRSALEERFGDDV